MPFWITIKEGSIGNEKTSCKTEKVLSCRKARQETDPFLAFLWEGLVTLYIVILSAILCPPLCIRNHWLNVILPSLLPPLLAQGLYSSRVRPKARSHRQNRCEMIVSPIVRIVCSWVPSRGGTVWYCFIGWKQNLGPWYLITQVLKVSSKAGALPWLVPAHWEAWCDKSRRTYVSCSKLRVRKVHTGRWWMAELYCRT